MELIFKNGLEVIEAVKAVDRRLKLGQGEDLSCFFGRIAAMKENIEAIRGEAEFIYDFLGTVLNKIFLADPANGMLTDRMYKYYMIHRFMELFGDHESVSDKVYITDRNVEQFISNNGERDMEKLLNILSQAGETLSRKMRKKLNGIIKENLSQLTSSTIYFAVTCGIIRPDTDVCTRLADLCSEKKTPGKIENTLFDPEYVIGRLRLYGYLGQYD
ncbi:MAG: hypothetical protein IJU93_09335 [Lachnospiraceae bacterium]|nr:hypothetical protein [Lachnospiraceae bacterium]